MAEREKQGNDLIFAMDIGTRSVVGIVGRAVDERFKVLAVEMEEHKKRSMLDGQIDDIQQVAALVRTVTQRLEERMDVELERVCVAAAGRALRTQSGSFSMELSGDKAIDAEQISQLEAGAVSAAEEGLQEKGEDDRRQFFLVGYTISQYRLDHYPLSALLGHSGRKVEADVVATFLPGEVVESLYAVMNAAGLQVASMTLEPIAAVNAAIPAELRLLNLALVDIGAGTTDIAICRDGSVVGYTMVTTAGDEITETLMRTYLVDFKTAEDMKRRLGGGEDLTYRDILGMEETVSCQAVSAAIQGPLDHLAEAIAEEVAAVNDGPPSALFLAGGGSKLEGLKKKVAERLGMDERRVAVAGSNYGKSAFSDDLDIEDPEYATPLGIAVSAGLGLLNDSYVVMLNGKKAKLFRNGVLTLRDILLMNGYTYTDILGKSGKSLMVTVDGKHMSWRGEPFTPAVLLVDGREAGLSAVIHAGEKIQFIPAVAGADAARTLEQVLGSDFEGRVLVNGQETGLSTQLKQGDTVITFPQARRTQAPEQPERPEERTQARETAPVQPKPAAPAAPAAKPVDISLNGQPLHLEGKEDGSPYFLMDLLDRSGLDLQNLDRPVRLEVNGVESEFRKPIKSGDTVTISCM